MSYKYLLKFIVIGDTGVGKSCLVLKFTDNKMRTEHEITVGIEFGSKQIKIDQDNIKLQLWDTAGQENFKSITRSYYKSAAGAVLTYDVTCQKSFQNVAQWLSDLKENCPTQIVIVLVGNKCDMENQREVTYEQGQELADENDLLFLESSAKTGVNVEEVFMSVAKKIHSQLGQGQLKLSENVGIKIGSDFYNSDNNQNQQAQNQENNQQSKSKKCC